MADRPVEKAIAAIHAVLAERDDLYPEDRQHLQGAVNVLTGYLRKERDR